MIASLGIRWTRLAGAALPRVAAVLFCLHFPIAAAFAAERDFTDFPATPADRLSLDTLIDLGLAYRAGEVAACHARVEILFDAYLQRHRRFAARREDPEAMTDYDVPQNVGPFFLDTVPPERRAAVMAAVETGDYRSILDSTADCLPRDEFLGSVGADKADE